MGDWRNVLVLVVTIVWAMSFLAPIFLTGYAPSAEIHIAFMAVITVVLGLKEPPSDS